MTTLLIFAGLFQQGKELSCFLLDQRYRDKTYQITKMVKKVLQ